MKMAAAALALMLLAPPLPRAEPPVPAWASRLGERLDRIDQRFAGDIGVYVQDLRSGDALSFRGDESWYLASGVKVPVAIAVMRSIEGGELSLDTTLVLEESDYVDGAGATWLQRPGSRLRVDHLLEQMLVRSDNTATDLLIRSVGLARVNRVAHELAAIPDGTITTLADVRRRAYSGFHPSAQNLRGTDLLALKRVRNDADRLQLLAKLLHVPAEQLQLQDFDSAFDAYYATRLNAATLRDYARMLRALAQGQALKPESTRHLMELLARVQTGKARIRAGLPPQVRFAHKTGTQRGRVCDFGVISIPAVPEPLLVIAACTRGEASLARSERALREIGAALAQSGLLAAPPVAGGA